MNTNIKLFALGLLLSGLCGYGMDNSSIQLINSVSELKPQLVGKNPAYYHLYKPGILQKGEYTNTCLVGYKGGKQSQKIGRLHVSVVKRDVNSWNSWIRCSISEDIPNPQFSKRTFAINLGLLNQKLKPFGREKYGIQFFDSDGFSIAPGLTISEEPKHEDIIKLLCCKPKVTEVISKHHKSDPNKFVICIYGKNKERFFDVAVNIKDGKEKFLNQARLINQSFCFKKAIFTGVKVKSIDILLDAIRENQ